eukprot:scaffold20085_cov58-Phaeocystis_antarctica.AAC.3
MKSIKVLTFQPGKPHDRFPVELVAKLLRMVDRAVFGEVQSGFSGYSVCDTFSRTESPLPKSLAGRESWSVDSKSDKVYHFDPISGISECVLMPPREPSEPQASESPRRLAQRKKWGGLDD